MLTYEASLRGPKHSDRTILIVVPESASSCWKTSRHVKIGPHISTWTGIHRTMHTVLGQSGHYQGDPRQAWNQYVWVFNEHVFVLFSTSYLWHQSTGRSSVSQTPRPSSRRGDTQTGSSSAAEADCLAGASGTG